MLGLFEQQRLQSVKRVFDLTSSLDFREHLVETGYRPDHWERPSGHQSSKKAVRTSVKHLARQFRSARKILDTFPVDLSGCRARGMRLEAELHSGNTASCSGLNACHGIACRALWVWLHQRGQRWTRCRGPVWHYIAAHTSANTTSFPSCWHSILSSCSSLRRQALAARLLPCFWSFQQ